MTSGKSLLIQQVRTLDPLIGIEQLRDVFIRDGAIAPDTNLREIPPETEIIAGHDLILGPGLVDLYSHSGEPGHEERETLASLGKAALAGGFTQVNILPNLQPAVDNPAVLVSLKQKTASSYPQLEFWGALTTNCQGQAMTELAELAPFVAGFSDGYPITNLNLLRRLLEYVQPLGKPLALVPSHPDLVGKGVMREGANSLRFGLPGNPASSEAVAIASILELLRLIPTPVHLMRISTQRGVELIAEAKAAGLPVTASTTWSHLLLDTVGIKTYDPNLRLEPPLGNAEDLQALITGVKSGVIDAIAVDHTPYTYEEKTLAFAEAPPGVIGLELALPLLWQRFVATGDWSPLTLWKALSVNPRLCLQQNPQISAQILFDPNHTWTVNSANLQSLSINTPWFGQSITGRVREILS